MCGICGYVGIHELPLERMMQTLDHRGPDNRYGITLESRNAIVGLGHTRLKILDLNDRANQPMMVSYDRYTLIYNGEIYNYRELHQELLPDIQLNTTSDTEVLMQLLLKYGMKVLDRLNGAFAFVWYDHEEQRMWIARDRMGIKPLYYHASKEQLVFASEIKAILAAGIRSKLNEEAITDYFVFKYTPEDGTLISGVKRVPPGAYVEVDIKANTLEVVHWYDLDSAVSNLKGISYRDARNRVFELIGDATESRLLSDVPVGTFFSGGVDSSIIAWHIKHHSELKHYCASKSKADIQKEGTTPDSAYAKQLAAQWGMDLTLVPIGDAELSKDHLNTVVHYGDDLIADASQIPAYLITQRASAQSKVILTGMGADELFLGYAGHQLTRLSRYLEWMPRGVRRQVLQKMSNMNAGTGRFKAYKRYFKKLGEYGDDPLKYGKFGVVGSFGRATEMLKRTNNNHERILARYFGAGQDVWSGIRDFERNNFLQKNLLYMDRMCMANSVENRVPFLDHRIVELAFAIDPSHKIDGRMGTKKILKDAYRKVLPKQIISRRKAGFGMPLRSIFSEPGRFGTIVDQEWLNEVGLFKPQEVQRAVDLHVNGKEDNSALLFAIAALERWMYEHEVEV